MKSYVET